MQVPYSIVGNQIMVVIGSTPKLIPSSSANFERLKAALRAPTHDIDLIAELSDIRTFVAKATFGAVQISDDKVLWNGTQVHNVLADRLIELLKIGGDLQPLALFLDRLMANPTESARSELYQWLESGNNPITPDGKFLGFKAVRKDYKDKHTGSMDNSVGTVVQMERSKVDPNRHNECSRGLHFCSAGYLSTFASSGDPVMIVEIDPADVVAIPTDYQHQKGRAWRYKVIAEVPREDVYATFFSGRPVDNRFTPRSVASPFVVGQQVLVAEDAGIDDNHGDAWLKHGDIVTIAKIGAPIGDEPTVYVSNLERLEQGPFYAAMFDNAEPAVTSGSYTGDDDDAEAEEAAAEGDEDIEEAAPIEDRYLTIGGFLRVAIEYDEDDGYLGEDDIVCLKHIQEDGKFVVRDGGDDEFTLDREFLTSRAIFLVGDTVRCDVTDGHSWVTEGSTYIVNGFDFDGEIAIESDEDGVGEIFVPALLFSLVKPVAEGEAFAEEPIVAEEIVEEAPSAGKELSFVHNGRQFLASEIMSLTVEHGQRGFQRLTGVQRTTLQGWLAKIKSAA